jgi:hypothetical protein
MNTCEIHCARCDAKTVIVDYLLKEVTSLSRALEEETKLVKDLEKELDERALEAALLVDDGSESLSDIPESEDGVDEEEQE